MPLASLPPTDCVYASVRLFIGGRITFRQQGEGDLYGNGVYLRPAYLTVSAKRPFIDIDNVLPAGVIDRFYIYVHNVTSLDAQSRRIRLQIWRRPDPTLRRFTLVWQQLIQVAESHNVGALYSVFTFQLSYVMYLSTFLLRQRQHIKQKQKTHTVES